MKDGITGYLLAGGRSRRLGCDKRLIRLGGVTLLERVASLLKATLGSPPILVGDNLAGVAPEGCVVLPDARPDSGPLGGLVAALDHCPTPWALVVAADMPHLSVDDLRRLIQAPREGLDGVSLKCGARVEPLAAIYASEVRSFWRRRLEAGDLSLKEGINLLRWGEVRLPRGSRALVNVNRML